MKEEIMLSVDLTRGHFYQLARMLVEIADNSARVLKNENNYYDNIDYRQRYKVAVMTLAEMGIEYEEMKREEKEDEKS